MTADGKPIEGLDVQADHSMADGADAQTVARKLAAFDEMLAALRNIRSRWGLVVMECAGDSGEGCRNCRHLAACQDMNEADLIAESAINKAEGRA